MCKFYTLSPYIISGYIKIQWEAKKPDNWSRSAKRCHYLLLSATSPNAGRFLLAQRCAIVVLYVSCVCLSVCPSVCPSERIELVSWLRGHHSIDLYYTVLERNSSISKNKGTSLCYFVPNSGLNKISQLPVDLSTCCQLRWTFSVMKWRRLSVVSLSHWASIFVYNTTSASLGSVCSSGNLSKFFTVWLGRKFVIISLLIHFSSVFPKQLH